MSKNFSNNNKNNSFSVETDEDLGDSICVINDHQSPNKDNQQSLAQTMSVVSEASMLSSNLPSTQFHEDGSLLVHRHNPMSMSLFEPSNSFFNWDKSSLILKFQSDKVKMYRLQVDNILNEIAMNPETFELSSEEKVLLEDISFKILTLIKDIGSCAKPNQNNVDQDQLKLRILDMIRQLDEQMNCLYMTFLMPNQSNKGSSNSNQSLSMTNDNSLYEVISISNDLNASLIKKKEKLVEQKEMIKNLIEMLQPNQIVNTKPHLTTSSSAIEIKASNTNNEDADYEHVKFSPGTSPTEFMMNLSNYPTHRKGNVGVKMKNFFKKIVSKSDDSSACRLSRSSSTSSRDDRMTQSSIIPTSSSYNEANSNNDMPPSSKTDYLNRNPYNGDNEDDDTGENKTLTTNETAQSQAASPPSTPTLEMNEDAKEYSINNDNNRLYFCTNCNLKIYKDQITEVKYLEHLQKCTNRDDLVCMFCFEVYSSTERDGLLAHLAGIHGLDENSMYF